MTGGWRPPTPPPPPEPSWYDSLPIISEDFESGYYLFATEFTVGSDSVKNMLLGINNVEGVLTASIIATTNSNCVLYSEQDEFFVTQRYNHTVSPVIAEINDVSGRSFQAGGRILVENIDTLKTLVLGKFY